MNRDTSKCYYGNQTFESGKTLTQELLGRGSCRPSCYCNQYEQNPATFVCSHYDCPEFFGRWPGPPPKQGEKCVVQKSLDKCCSEGRVCGKAIEKLETCEYNGETYHEGEFIDLKETCTHSCICGKGFNDNKDKPLDKNPNCKRDDCNLNLKNEFAKGCIPIFDKR